MTEQAASESREVTTAQPQAQAVQAVRERLITQNSVAIWDTAELEHMGRVGAIMADSGLMSETFMKDGDAVLERTAVIARCVMVANLAREVGANPLMFIQSCSIISRKLHIEGKAVSAIITARTGVKLKYRFGRWNVDHIEFPPLVQATDEQGQAVEEGGKPVMIPDPEFFKKLEERLAVRVYDPADPERYVDGSVGLWKTTRSGSPWSNPGNWRRQLRYRGAPEWARAYEPGAILGIYSDADGLDDDETVAVEARAPKAPRNLRGRLQAGQEAAQAQSAADEPGEPENPPHDAETGEIIDAEVEEITSPPAASDAPIAEEASDTPASAADASTTSAAETSEGGAGGASQDTDEPKAWWEDYSVTDGQPAAGQVYRMAGDQPNSSGRIATYVDGKAHSTVSEKGAGSISVFANHAPKADPTPAPKEEPKVEAPAEAAAITTSPEDRRDPAQDAEVEEEPAGPSFLDRIKAANTWAEIKGEWVELNKDPDWADVPAEEQDEVRALTWGEAHRVGANALADPTAFGLWIYAQTDPGMIGEALARLEEAEAFKNAKEAVQAAVRNRAAARIAAVSGAE